MARTRAAPYSRRVSEPELPPAARAFLDGDVELLPSAIAAADVDRLVALLVERGDVARLDRLASSPEKSLAKPSRKFELQRGPYAEEEGAPSIATGVDGHGDELVFLVRPSPDRAGFVV